MFKKPFVEEQESSSLGTREPWKVLEGALWKGHTQSRLALERTFCLLLCSMDIRGEAGGKEAGGEAALV